MSLSQACTLGGSTIKGTSLAKRLLCTPWQEPRGVAQHGWASRHDADQPDEMCRWISWWHLCGLDVLSGGIFCAVCQDVLVGSARAARWSDGAAGMSGGVGEA